MRACQDALEQLAKDTASECAALVTSLWPGPGGRPHNAVALIEGGAVKGVSFKVDLPNYGVFDEKRIFAAGERNPASTEVAGVRLGVPICEDIWGCDPCATLASRGAEILLVPNGSPRQCSVAPRTTSAWTSRAR